MISQYSISTPIQTLTDWYSRYLLNTIDLDSNTIRALYQEDGEIYLARHTIDNELRAYLESLVQCPDCDALIPAHDWGRAQCNHCGYQDDLANFSDLI